VLEEGAMAWLVSVSVECGGEGMDAAAVASELQRRLGGRAWLFSDGDGAPWASVLPADVEPDDVDAVATWSEGALAALAELEVPFRFGLAGLEVDEARTWAELVDDLAQGAVLPDVVMHRDVHRALGAPEAFAPFGRHFVSR